MKLNKSSNQILTILSQLLLCLGRLFWMANLAGENSMNNLLSELSSPEPDPDVLKSF